MKILIPTDFTDSISTVLKYVNYVFTPDSSKYLLHAFVTNYYTPVEPVSDSNIIKRKVLDQMRNFLENSGFKENHELVADYGLVTDVIIKNAEVLDVDLIVMGTQGAKKLASAVLGSNASAVLKKANIPVMIIPPQVTVGTPKKIAVASEPGDSISSKNLIFDWFPDAKVKTIQFVKDKQRNYQKTGDMIELLFENEIYRSMQDFVSENDIDLLVLKSKKYDLVDRIFHKSLTKKLALHSNIPMMVLKN